MFSSHVLSSYLEEKDVFKAKIEQWNKLEQLTFIIEIGKLLSTNLIKFMGMICSDLVEIKNPSSSENQGPFLSSNEIEKNHYANILEEQANDISYFHVLKDKPIITKIKMLLSYLPVLKVNKDDQKLNLNLKSSYDSLINELLKFSLEKNIFLMECYELSLLSHIHPIFDEKQKSRFKNLSNMFQKSLYTSRNQSIRNNMTWSFAKTDPFENINEHKGTNSIQSQTHDYFNPTNSTSQSEFSTSSNKSLGFYSNSFDEEEFFGENSYPSLNQKNLNLSKITKTNNNPYVIDQSECSSSLNISLHMESTTASQKQSDNDNENSKKEMPCQNNNLVNNSNTNTDHNLTTSTTERIYRHPPLRASASLPHTVNSNKSLPVLEKTENNRSLLQSYSSSQDLNLPMKSKTNEIDSSMKGIFQWLKVLRLHKYISHFSQITYDEFLALNDEKLINLNITLGARKKLLNNIEILNGRCARLKQIIKNLDLIFQNETDLEKCLDELLEISLLPMKCQASKMTSLRSLDLEINYQKNMLNEDEEKNDDLSKIFIKLLEKLQKLILKEEFEKTSVQEKDAILTPVMKTFIQILIKIIDNLFLSKAFNDVQNVYLAKMRSSLFKEIEKESSSNIDKQLPNFRKLLTKINPNPYVQAQTQLLNTGQNNFFNARQRIVQKNFRTLEKASLFTDEENQPHSYNS